MIHEAVWYVKLGYERPLWDKKSRLGHYKIYLVQGT